MKNSRLYPSIINERYYGLKILAKELSVIFSKVIKPDSFVLDYGCGTMPYKELVEKFRGNYYGADLENNTNADITLKQESFNIQLGNNIADVVLSTQVLEHVSSPKKYLIEAKRVCKENGILILSTHGFWPYHPDPTDYWRWTKQGLIKELEDVGWMVEDSTSIMGLGAAALQLLQDAIINKLPSKLHYLKINKLIALFFQLIILFTDNIKKSENKDLNDACLYIIIARNKSL